jgi:hypothetical protein
VEGLQIRSSLIRDDPNFRSELSGLRS